MTSKVYFPTLSEEGWINDSLRVMNILFSHFISSHHSQTFFYGNNVASLPYLIQQAGNDMSILSTSVTNTLKNYYMHYFNDVDVSVNINGESNNSSKQVMKIYLMVKDSENKEYTLARSLKLDNGVAKLVIDNNNG